MIRAEENNSSLAPLMPFKTVFDNVVVKDGKISLINETKTGGGQLTKQQERFFNKGESVELVGGNAKGVKGSTISNVSVDTRLTKVKVNE